MSSAYQPSLVSLLFETLLGRIQLTSTDSTLFESHRASVRSNLAAASGDRRARRYWQRVGHPAETPLMADAQSSVCRSEAHCS